MKWHCGLLSEQPEKDRTLNYIKRGYWYLPAPPEVTRELRIWLAMPGFSVAYHAHVFRVGAEGVKNFIASQDFSDVQAEVAENWLSVTDEDAVRLARMRPGTGNLPLICQLRILDALKQGMKRSKVAELYGVTPQTVYKIKKGHLTNRGVRPSVGGLLGTPS
jgi:hypothetical protein